MLVIHECPKERVERCDLYFLPPSPPPHPPLPNPSSRYYNDEPITKIKKKVNDLKEPNITFSANTKSDAKKEKKREKKRRKICCRTKSNANKDTTLFAAEDTKADANFSLSLSLSFYKTHKINTKKIMTKNNKAALF